MQAVIYAADLQDRDGGVLLMATMFGLCLLLLKLYADGGYQGLKFHQSLAQICSSINVETVRQGQVRAAAEALDREAHHRIAEPVSTAGQRLGMR